MSMEVRRKKPLQLEPEHIYPVPLGVDLRVAKVALEAIEKLEQQAKKVSFKLKNAKYFIHSVAKKETKREAQQEALDKGIKKISESEHIIGQAFKSLKTYKSQMQKAMGGLQEWLLTNSENTIDAEKSLKELENGLLNLGKIQNDFGAVQKKAKERREKADPILMQKKQSATMQIIPMQLMEEKTVDAIPTIQVLEDKRADPLIIQSRAKAAIKASMMVRKVCSKIEEPLHFDFEKDFSLEEVGDAFKKYKTSLKKAHSYLKAAEAEEQFCKTAEADADTLSNIKQHIDESHEKYVSVQEDVEEFIRWFGDEIYNYFWDKEKEQINKELYCFQIHFSKIEDVRLNLDDKNWLQDILDKSCKDVSKGLKIAHHAALIANLAAEIYEMEQDEINYTYERLALVVLSLLKFNLDVTSVVYTVCSCLSTALCEYIECSQEERPSSQEEKKKLYEKMKSFRENGQEKYRNYIIPLVRAVNELALRARSISKKLKNEKTFFHKFIQNMDEIEQLIINQGKEISNIDNEFKQLVEKIKMELKNPKKAKRSKR